YLTTPTIIGGEPHSPTDCNAAPSVPSYFPSISLDVCMAFQSTSQSLLSDSTVCPASTDPAVLNGRQNLQDVITKLCTGLQENATSTINVSTDPVEKNMCGFDAPTSGNVTAPFTSAFNYCKGTTDACCTADANLATALQSNNLTLGLQLAGALKPSTPTTTAAAPPGATSVSAPTTAPPATASTPYGNYVGFAVAGVLLLISAFFLWRYWAPPKSPYSNKPPRAQSMAFPDGVPAVDVGPRPSMDYAKPGDGQMMQQHYYPPGPPPMPHGTGGSGDSAWQQGTL
ncbi:hypothetical protein HK101_007048, partial [Irineochytrium annulatum]